MPAQPPACMDGRARTFPSLVSVIVPTHLSMPPFLEATLRSLIAQDYETWEALVIDDGSPDPDALERLCSIDERIHVIHQAHRGIAASRNLGWTLAQGDLIAFLDHDDIWYPCHLATLVPALSLGTEAVGAFSRFELLSGNEQHTSRTSHAEPCVTRHSILSGGPRPSLITLLLRRSHIEAVGGFSMLAEGADDVDLIVRLILHGHFISLTTVTAAYRRHDFNTSRDIRLMASRLDSSLADNIGRLRVQGDAVDIRDLRTFKTSARRAYARTATHHALRSLLSGPRLNGFNLLLWAITFSPVGAGRALLSASHRHFRACTSAARRRFA